MPEQGGPHKAAQKNIVICCDGTGNQFSTDPTNVLRLWRSLTKDATQLTYYDPGVGTLGDPRALTRLRKLMHRHLDGAIGLGVRENALQAYEFLIENWNPSDRIFLFGFSRGAYTIRALAGMIGRFGIMRPEHRNIIPYVWLVYSDDSGEIATFDDRMRIARGMRKSLAEKASVHFIGAWDTVSSFGWMWNPKSLPDTAKVPCAKHIRHAVSIHERRACFRQNLFTPAGDLKDNCIQMLFNGVHADVGGGYPAEESGLAKLALQWMKEEAVALGLLVDETGFDPELNGKNGGQGPNPDGPIHNESRKWKWRLIEALPRSPAGWSLLFLSLATAVITAYWTLAYAMWILGAVLLLGLVRLILIRWNGRVRDFQALGDSSPLLEHHPSVRARE